MRRHQPTKTVRRLLAGAAGTALALAWAGAAAAADAADAASQVAEVVVTAQKKVERLQDVPASVSVLATEQLTSQGVVRFEDYAAKVPGLSFTSARTGSTQVTLRGITTGPAQSASATSFYIDEAPIGSVNAYTGGSSTTPDLDPSDLARVEVLKGPQGTLYGAGSVGGLVKFVTSEPDFNNLTGRVSGSLFGVKSGDTGGGVRAAVNVPLLPGRMALRVSGFDRRDPGYIDLIGPRPVKDVNETKVYGGRIALSARLTDTVRVDLSVIGQDTETGGPNVRDVNLTTLKPIYGDLVQQRFAREPAEVRLRVYNAKATADLGAVSLLSSTTYQTFKVKGEGDASGSFGAALGPLVGLGSNLGVRTRQQTKTERFSQEFRADAKALDDKLDLQLGLYFTHENDGNRIPNFDTFLKPTGALLPLPQLAIASIVSRYTEYSAFASATYRFTDDFDVLGGIRYADDHQHYLQDYAGLLIGARRVNIGQEKGHIFTYLLSPRFRFNEHTMVYARLATGYRAGGPNAVPPPSVVIAPDTFDPDKLTSIEAGYKADFFDRTLTVDAAVFYTDWNHIQIQTSAAGFNFLVNGGSATSQGGEVTVRWTPVRGLDLGLNSAFTKAQLTSPAPAAGGLEGDRLPFVPRWSGSLTADYHWPVADGWDAVVGGSLNYTGKRKSDYSNRFGRDLPSFTRVDVRAGIEHEGWTATIYAKNLGDVRGITALGSQGLAPGPQSPYSEGVIQPRTVGAELSYKF
ncbi:MAG TPA: TonB-dependent receptor [Phenylobacterium sp.]